jgi:hypothetical protein
MMRIVGTLDYMVLELTMTTKETDVFTFGALLLEV